MLDCVSFFKIKNKMIGGVKIHVLNGLCDQIFARLHFHANTAKS